MNLYENKNLFIDYIKKAAEFFGINETLIEKDFYIYLFLKECSKVIPQLVFKGGTSLSKCHKIIDRFSEDIDLTLQEEFSSQSFKRNSLRKLIEISNYVPFLLLNKENRLQHTHANYNCFKIDYPAIYKDTRYYPGIKMEMVYLSKCYPYEEKTFVSYIGEYLMNINENEIISKYELEPFPIKVQRLERTFVDKVFAICDYFELKETRRNSRHIYDLYKIYPNIDVTSDSFKELVKRVRKERQNTKRCVSSQPGYDINKTLKQIIESQYYKNDFDSVTSVLLNERKTYSEVVEVLTQIINSNAFVE